MPDKRKVRSDKEVGDLEHDLGLPPGTVRNEVTATVRAGRRGGKTSVLLDWARNQLGEAVKGYAPVRDVAPKQKRRDKGACAVCMNRFRLRSDGTVRVHFDYWLGRQSTMCAGSKRKPHGG